MKKVPMILLLVHLIAFAALTALPVGAQDDPCADPATRPDWCTGTPPPSYINTPTPHATQPAGDPYPEPDPAPYPEPVDEPYPGPARDHSQPSLSMHSKPWLLFNLTALEWGKLTPAQRLPYWRTR